MRIMLDLVVKGLTACAAAFQFLSRLPVPVKLDYTDALFRRSVVFYPLVGGVLGLMLAMGGWLLESGFPAVLGIRLDTGVSAALLLALWVGLTGALHLDGLMDTADGILSHRPREQMLEIMKDSRVGAMGVVVCALLLLCKWTLLQQWLMLPGGRFGYMLPLALSWSRWYMAVAIACWPYARQGQPGNRGLGSFFRGLGWRHLAMHTLLALLLSAGFAELSGIAPASAQGVLLLGACTVGTLAIGAGMSFYLSRRLGGLTGDTYGAMNEILETALLLLLYIVLGKETF